MWELASGACVHALQAHNCSVSSLGWHLASGCLATGGEDGKVHLWDVSALEDRTGGGGGGGGGGGDVALVDHAVPELVRTVDMDHSEVLCIIPSADGTALFCGLDVRGPGGRTTAWPQASHRVPKMPQESAALMDAGSRCVWVPGR